MLAPETHFAVISSLSLPAAVTDSHFPAQIRFNGSPRRLEKQTQGKRVCAVGGGVLMAPVTYKVRNSWRGSSGGSLHASQMVLLCRQVNQAHLRGAWAGSRKPWEVDLEVTFLLKKNSLTSKISLECHLECADS